MSVSSVSVAFYSVQAAEAQATETERSHDGYAGFAQRLETLAAQYGGSPAAAEKPAPAAVTA